MANQVILKKSAGAAPATQLAEAELAYAEHATKGGELYIGAIGAGSNILIGAADSAKLTGGTFTGTVELDPSDQTDAADAITRGQAAALLLANWEAKDEVAVATSAALSPGNTGTTGVLTATGVGVLTVDGVAVTANMRLLVKDEVDQSNNGIYDCTTEGTAGVAYVLTRSLDANTSDEVKRGMNCWVAAGGTDNGTTQWLMVSPDPVLNTDPVTFEKVSGLGGITAGTGLEIVANVIGVADEGVTEDQLAASVAGAGLAGGAGTVLSVGAGTSITVDGTSIRISDAGITSTQLAAAVAGDGIAGGNGTALTVDVGDGLVASAHAVSVDYGFTSTEVLEGNSALDAGSWT